MQINHSLLRGFVPWRRFRSEYHKETPIALFTAFDGATDETGIFSLFQTSMP
jgi:hypothetical protein